MMEKVYIPLVGNGTNQGTVFECTGGSSINAYFRTFSALFWAISFPNNAVNTNIIPINFTQVRTRLQSSQTAANFTLERSVHAPMLVWPF